MCFLLAQQVASGALRLMEIRDMMWIYAVVILLLSEAWCMDEGTNHTSLNSSTVYDVRHSAFNMGSEVNLTCSNKTWNEMLYVIWNIKLQYKECKIACRNGVSDDRCNDGKSLRNTSSLLPYLHIPNISADDGGVYSCESVFNGGIENHVINVAVIVPPSSTSAWFEYKGNTVVAVCIAERGKPAANISWSHMGKSSSVETSSGGYFTVESRLELLEGMDTDNVSCVIRHPYWKEERVLPLKPEEGSFARLCVLIVGVIIVFLAGLLFFIQKKLMPLRRSPRSEAPLPKSPQTEDVEEVEPYASYVQRVNSIYNSSADLFT